MPPTITQIPGFPNALVLHRSGGASTSTPQNTSVSVRSTLNATAFVRMSLPGGPVTFADGSRTMAAPPEPVAPGQTTAFDLAWSLRRASGSAVLNLPVTFEAFFVGDPTPGTALRSIALSEVQVAGQEGTAFTASTIAAAASVGAAVVAVRAARRAAKRPARKAAAAPSREAERPASQKRSASASKKSSKKAAKKASGSSRGAQAASKKGSAKKSSARKASTKASTKKSSAKKSSAKKASPRKASKKTAGKSSRTR